MQIKSAHSEQDVRYELALMVEGGSITLRQLMQLYLRKSALILGGVYDEAEAERVQGLIDGVDEWINAATEIKAAFRALEIIQSSKDEHGDKSDYGTFSPEWLADIITIATGGLHDTANNIMDAYPLAVIFHAVAAVHRRNGGITKRPLDHDAILQALKG